MIGTIATAVLETPIGWVSVKADDAQLLAVRLSSARQSASATNHPLLREALLQLRDWFSGGRMSFDLPLAPPDSAEGEKHRAGIAGIPYGETLTYGFLAARIGSAAQAVGQACKTNPFPIIIPCHRVVSTAGPEYYSAGDGPRTKTWLLDFEYGNLPREQRTRLI